MTEIMELNTDFYFKYNKKYYFEALILFPLYTYAEERLLDHMVVQLLVFSGLCILFFFLIFIFTSFYFTILFLITVVPGYIPTNSVLVICFLHILKNTCHLYY